MEGLLAVDGAAVIAERVAAGSPVLAICVGHQVLFGNGIEHRWRPPAAGSGRGRSSDCTPSGCPTWAGTPWPSAAGSSLFAGIETERFYFVHSYGVRELAEVDGRLVTWAEHGGDRFVAAVEQGPLWSTQFHPEKSGAAGGRLIANWVATLRSDRS